MTADHDAHAAAFPCVRGCSHPHDEGATAKPKGARHGDLCDSCFYRLVAALKLVPDLVANMRAQLWGIGAADYSERVGGGGAESPAPMNLGPLDAGDSLFARLHSWASFFAEEFGVPAPNAPAWVNARGVQGSQIVSVETATRRAADLTGWLAVRLDEICGTTSAATFHDDLCYGDEDSRSVFSLSAAYGIKARPTPKADKRECPSCGEIEAFLKLPDTFDSEYAVMCGRCGWVADPATHARHTAMFERANPTGHVAVADGTCGICCGTYSAGNLVVTVFDGTRGADVIHLGCEGDLLISYEVERERIARGRNIAHRAGPDNSRPGVRGDASTGRYRGAVAGSVRAAGSRDVVDSGADVEQTRRARVKPFVAKFAGACAGGCDGIEPGDVVQYDDGARMHADCENSEGLRADRIDYTAVTCTNCWLIQPCGCGEF